MNNSVFKKIQCFFTGHEVSNLTTSYPDSLTLGMIPKVKVDICNRCKKGFLHIQDIQDEFQAIEKFYLEMLTKIQLKE